MALRTSAVSVSIFLAATLCSAGETRPGKGGTSGGSRLVSPAVVATWIVRTEPSGVAELKLLVLWRGAPGWFLRTDSSGLSGRILTQSGGGESDGVHVHNLSFGGIPLNLEFDSRKRLARVQGNDVPLESANVILVDDVDGNDGPQVVRLLRVDPAFPESPARIEAIIRRSPDLFSFLRCDSRVPDSKVQSMLDAVCAQMKRP